MISDSDRDLISSSSSIKRVRWMGRSKYYKESTPGAIWPISSERTSSAQDTHFNETDKKSMVRLFRACESNNALSRSTDGHESSFSTGSARQQGRRGVTRSARERGVGWWRTEGGAK